MSRYYQYNFADHKQGDTFSGVRFNMVLNGSVLPLTGASIKMELRKLSPSNEVAKEYSLGSGLTIVDAPNGQFTFDEQIVDLEPSEYCYSIEIITVDSKVKTYIEGTWNITNKNQKTTWKQ